MRLGDRTGLHRGASEIGRGHDATVSDYDPETNFGDAPGRREAQTQRGGPASARTTIGSGTLAASSWIKPVAPVLPDRD
jgi:hypothetical protein